MNHLKRWFLALMICLLLMGAGNLGVASAQDDVTPTPPASTPAPENTPTITETPAVQNMPASESTPEVTGTTSAANTPIPTVESNQSVLPEGTTISDILRTLPWKDIIELVISSLIIILLAHYGSKLLVLLLKRVVRRTNSDIDEGILEAIRPQISWFIAAIGFQIVTARLDFLSDNVKAFLQDVYFILYLFVIIATFWRVGDFALDRYVSTNKEKLNANLVQQIFPLIKRLSHLVLAFIGAVILAAHFGIDVLAISAALGLGGFAIALAAKDTISNIISGLVIMISQPFKVGDRIDVPGLGGWGDAVEIGIRSSKVLMRDNRFVIVPNSAIVDNMVVNYSTPDPTYRLQSDIGLGCGVDIPKVQQMIKDTVRQVEGVLPDKNVDVWFTEFSDYANTFRVRWWVASYAEKRSSTNAVNAAIQELANREGIDMPNPTMTLDNKVMLSDENAQTIAHDLSGRE